MSLLAQLAMLAKRVLALESGIDTTGDVLVDNAAKGFVWKDAQEPPHYWRITVAAGLVVAADLGTTKP